MLLVTQNKIIAAKRGKGQLNLDRATAMKLHQNYSELTLPLNLI